MKTKIQNRGRPVDWRATATQRLAEARGTLIDKEHVAFNIDKRAGSVDEVVEALKELHGRG